MMCQNSSYLTHAPLKKVRHKKSRKQIATHTYPFQKMRQLQAV